MAERPDFPRLEEEILEYWKKHNIFKKTLEKPAPRGNFVFFEGPPTANGKPGIHHVESRAYKDVIPRFKTMQGYRVDRKAGWDTHGLPVEIEVEKKLGISGKPQIESLKATPRESIAYFNDLCKQSVWTYLEDWKALTERIGFWLDLEHPYITYQNEYIETLWWIIKKINERGLLYRDYKVVPYCARCGTPLSSHELALGYEEAEDPSIYVKFRVTRRPPSPLPSPLEGEGKGEGAPVYFLVWTTTPWTLPGNVALAVGEEIEYVKVEIKRSRDQEIEHLILAKARLSVLEGEYEILEEYKGKDLVGWEYEPLYSFVPLEAKAHYVALADFVSIEDGTGIVHTAVMYGAEDFELGQKIGLPKQHLVDLKGEFIPEVKPWAGIFVKKADPLIIEELKSRGLLYRAETIRHTYPFCWRCKTPLLYYARDSWFVEMSTLRDELIGQNSTVNWVPSYIKEGRFGEWLREVKDWAFSRERYWGTPLPLWQCDGCGNRDCIGSFEELKDRAKARNRFILMRHGESRSNTTSVISSRVETSEQYPLTSKGEERVRHSIEELRRAGITKIIASPFYRMKQTAGIISKAIGITVDYHDELREFDLPDFDGKPTEEFNRNFANLEEKFTKKIGNNETWEELARRLMNFLRDYDRSHEGETVLVCTHGDPLFLLEWANSGRSRAGLETMPYPTFDAPIEFPFLSSLVNDQGELDLHRPYIDDVVLSCANCNGVMRRTIEVCDVWFDSGSMPLAQWHYPFENNQKIDGGVAFPADYISEAIDQTRGWFYTLLAVSTLLGKPAPYRNVICLGHLLDKDGKKMSKSLGNVVDPWEMVRKYGADSVRWYMYSINQPGDPKNFDEADLDRIVKQNFMILWNVLAFWRLYASEQSTVYSPQSTADIMDQWVISRLNQLTKTVTEQLETYDVTSASRALALFTNELSTWYVRRSRERFKSGDQQAVTTLGHVLGELAKLMAPFAPFFAEYLYREVYSLQSTVYSSVHLESWPTANEVNTQLLEEMDLVRSAAELGHAIRAGEKIRVRQPLADLKLETAGKKIRPELLTILADELNVKNAHLIARTEAGLPDGSPASEGYILRSANGLTIALNLTLTPELKREGLLRELIRTINEMRKEAGLTIKDRIRIHYETTDPELRDIFEKSADDLQKGTLAEKIMPGSVKNPKKLTLDNKNLALSIEII